MDERTQAARRDALNNPEMRRRYAALQCGRLGHVFEDVIESTGPFSTHAYLWPIDTIQACTRCGLTDTALVKNVPLAYLDEPPAFYTLKVPERKIHVINVIGENSAFTLCKMWIHHDYDKNGIWVSSNVVKLLSSEPTCKKCLKTSAEPDVMEVHRSIFAIIWKETAYKAYRQNKENE